MCEYVIFDNVRILNLHRIHSIPFQQWYSAHRRTLRIEWRPRSAGVNPMRHSDVTVRESNCHCVCEITFITYHFISAPFDLWLAGIGTFELLHNECEIAMPLPTQIRCRVCSNCTLRTTKKGSCEQSFLFEIRNSPSSLVCIDSVRSAFRGVCVYQRRQFVFQ